MLEFMKKYEAITTSVLNGFDRIVFRGHLRSLCYPDGMKKHLSQKDVPRRSFGAHVERTTSALKKASLAEAEELGRPVIYLSSSRIRKVTVAEEVLAKNPVDSGLLCVLKCVEPCMAYDMYRNKDAKKLELVYRLRKCLHLYHYYVDPRFGLMHARIQTWYPFHIQVCMNGRSWLARRMDEDGCPYTQQDNAFPHLEDPLRAQQLMNELTRLNWAEQLDAIATRINPAHDQLISPLAKYYWSAHQTEWATDITFTSPQALQRIYPQLLWGAITTFSSGDVMRFLGKQLQRPFQGEVISHYQDRPEGLRIKHAVNANSVKTYNKGTCMLRVETTINKPSEIQVYRPKEGGPPESAAPRPMRKGVADLQRRTQVSQRANDRYLDALSEFDTNTALGKVLTPITKRISKQGRKHRGLRPWSTQDLELLKAINRPEHLIAGFRNIDLSRQLFPGQQSEPSKKRAASAKTSYRLRLLRAHGIIRKIPRTRRYRITPKGREICTALLLAQHATIKQLNPKAA